MGQREIRTYRLVDEPLPSELPTDVSQFVEQALRSRPELLSLRNQQEAALKLAQAEKEARYPSISAIGATGIIPIHDTQLPDYYAAAGVSMSLPLFAGGYYSAKQQQAELQAKAAEEGLRDLEDNVIRDVRIAWLNAQNAFQRLLITGQLLDNAKQTFDLAQARYTNGISSIVEFNQAQLNLITAQIAYANTQYEYLVQRSALNFQTGALR
jgi:outer membrane protein